MLMDRNEIHRQQDLERLVQEHAWDNKLEVLASETCICCSCSIWLVPSDIVRWYEDKHACCPRCGLAGVIIGSASGLPLGEFLD